MKSPVHLPELLLGALGVLGSLTLQEYAALAVAFVTIAAMLPLAIWRWRALLSGKPKQDTK